MNRHEERYQAAQKARGAPPPSLDHVERAPRVSAAFRDLADAIEQAEQAFSFTEDRLASITRGRDEAMNASEPVHTGIVMADQLTHLAHRVLLLGDQIKSFNSRIEL